MNKERLGLRTHPSVVTDHKETGHKVQNGKANANANVERVAQKCENRAKNCGRTERAVTSKDKRFLAAPREKNGRQLSLLSKISFTSGNTGKDRVSLCKFIFTFPPFYSKRSLCVKNVSRPSSVNEITLFRCRSRFDWQHKISTQCTI